MQTPLLIPRDSRNSAVESERSRWLAALARQALIAEAELTPKPGLVDRRGAGAHTDLSLELMLRSATVLEPYFAAIGLASEGRDLDTGLRKELAAIGREAERAMYEVTHGSNTHKGAIWSLGLLTAAAVLGEGQDTRAIAAIAGAIARLPDRVAAESITHGDVVRVEYGVTGARGEAASGFPHIVRFGLPTLRKQRAAGLPEEVCRLDALFNLMSHLDDTCVLYRGGAEALRVTKTGARAVLRAGGAGSQSGQAQMRQLERELVARRASPGGSADLLAATIFLDAVERLEAAVRADHSTWEEGDGAV